MQTKDCQYIAAGVLVLLLVPLVGNLFLESFNWGIGDYVVMGVLLFVMGVLMTAVRRTVSSPIKRVVITGGVILLGLLIWAELAVDAVSQAIGFH